VIQSGERMQELFSIASELDGPERDRFLERECPEPDLRAEVFALLAEPVEHDFLVRPLVAPDLLDRLEAAPPEPSLDRLGPFRVLRLLGEGSAGVVYLAAQDEPVQRQVALKVLHPGANTQRVMARFRAEGRALAAMDHPNIARLYDVRTTHDGRPFFVMEPVLGEPITRFCERRGLGRAARLRLLATACSAAQHAHAKGVIHRDIKPSNILAFDGPEGPALKIIDFGVAKIVAPDHDASHTTQQGAILGTLAYMSPEQVDGTADARSDVYSLGAVAYEVLTGRRPVAVSDVPLSEAIRRIRESAPLAPGRIDRALRGDADAILFKALAKDPDRRYATADALGADLLRLACGEPVVARGSGAIYVLATLARRHRRTVAAMGAAAMVVLAALTFGAVGLVRARESGFDAARAEAQAIETLAFTARHALGELDGTVSTHAVREQVATRLDADSAEMLRRRPHNPAVLGLRADVLVERSRLLLDRGDAAGSLEMRRQAAAVRRRLLDHNPADADVASSYSIDLVLIGDALGDLRDLPGQREMYEQAAHMHETLVARHGRPIDLSRLSWSRLRMAALGGELPDRIELARECLDLSERLVEADPSDLTARDCARQAHTLLAGLVDAQGDHAARDRHLDAESALALQLILAEPANTLYTEGYLHSLLVRAGFNHRGQAHALDQEGYRRARVMYESHPADREAIYFVTAFALRRAATAAPNAPELAQTLLDEATRLGDQFPAPETKRDEIRGWIEAEVARVRERIVAAER
jgi:hypothetical protein